MLLTVLLCLSGCYPLKPMYEQEDADRITQKGTELMQSWLNNYMPGAELRECTADRLMWRGDGNQYLTGYAYGSIEDKDQVTEFAVDTQTGDVYFKMDQDTQRALDRAMASYLYECMGIVQEYDDDGFSCFTGRKRVCSVGRRPCQGGEKRFLHKQKDPVGSDLFPGSGFGVRGN